MFNYKHSVVLNDVSRIMPMFGFNNSLEKGFTHPKLVIKNDGNYDLCNIIDASSGDTVDFTNSTKTLNLLVYPYREADYSALKIKTAKLTNEKANYQLLIDVQTPIGALGQFASPGFMEFGKPLMIGFSTKKDDLSSSLYKALKESLEAYEDNFVKVSKDASDDSVVLTALDSDLVFREVILQKEGEVPVSCSCTDPAFVDVESFHMNLDNIADADSVFKVYNSKHLERGTYKWMMENLRFPTSENVRYTPVVDELPVKGVVYDELVFQYKAKRQVAGGLSAVDQVVESVTSHSFFIPHNKWEEVKSIIENAKVDSSEFTNKVEGEIAFIPGDNSTVASMPAPVVPNVVRGISIEFSAESTA